jgi:hypothetical protein
MTATTTSAVLSEPPPPSGATLGGEPVTERNGTAAGGNDAWFFRV